jgi:S-layer homology domain
LSSGFSTFLCIDATRGNSAYYGRFSVAYQELQSYLEDCTYSVSGNNVFSSALGGTGTYPVTTPGVCKWTAKTSADWIQIVGGTLSPLYPQSLGTEGIAIGNGTVVYNVLPNFGSSPRFGTITVAGQNFYVSQAPSIPLQLFSDIPPTHSFADYVNILTLWGSGASGCPQGKFCPDIPTTRTMMAEFIVRLLYGENFTSSPIPYFTDVATNHPSFRYIQKLRETSITIGCGNGSTYCANDPVTREQMAAFIVRTIMVKNGQPALGPFNYSPVPYFTDVPATSIYFTWVQKMKELGITSGTSATTYAPSDPNTRGQIAVFLVRASLSP